MKTMQKTLAAAALAVFLTALPAASYAGTSVSVEIGARINSHPTNDLQVWIWPDRGEGSEYFPGDRIWMNVEVTRDCFLILYDIDTRGNLRILFPYDPWDDNFVAAGEVVSFPRSWDGYEWTVEGPPGIEYVQAIASEFPINPPDWPVYIRSVNHGGAVHYDAELRDFRAGDDHLDYMRIVNRKITGRFWDWCATDIASFYVNRPYHTIYHRYDPWPDNFYGAIYIGWPIGGRIYIDGVFIGVAPLWIPRHVHYGPHVIVCRDHDRVIRRQTIHYHAKNDFRHDLPRYKRGKVKDYGHVKIGRPGGREKFKDEVRHRHRDRVIRDPNRDDRIRERTRVETPPPERRKTETRDDFNRSRTRGETRGEIGESRTKVDVKRERTKVEVKGKKTTSGSSSKATTTRKKVETGKSVAKTDSPAVSKKKSGGLGGFISSVAKTVSRSAKKSETKAASKSSSSVKSKEVKKSSSSAKKKVSARKSVKGKKGR